MGKDCKYCGAYISDIVDVCPACGKKVKAEKASEVETYESVRRASTGAAAEQAPQQEKRTTTQEATYTYKQEYERRYGQYREQERAEKNGGSAENKSAGVSAENEDVRQNKTICYLCYLGPLFLIPYLTRRESDFVRYHSNQGLLLLLADIICGACGALPIIGWLIELLGTLFVLGGLISGLSNVNKGIKKPLPIIGEIKILN